jgi:hypothetical protein
MSVDYYSCSCCNESVYSEFVTHCSGCGKGICTHCLINVPDDIGEDYGRYAHNYGVRYDGTEEQKELFSWISSGNYEIGELIDDAGIDFKYCPFCSGEEVHDSDILNLALEKLNLTTEDLKQEILIKRKGKE